MSKNNKTLVIVESPAKAKTINKYLGDDYIVKASFGHMFDLPKKDIGIDIENGFEPKIELMDDKKDKLKVIQDAVTQVDKILIASDPDREGEAIGYFIAKALEKYKKEIKRVEFHEITKKGVKEGLSNIHNINLALCDAQKARRVLDRLVGYTVSPYVIRHFGNNLSAGRVQSVVVRMIVDREKEIESFKPEEYWNISATLAKSLKKSESFVAKYVKKVTNEKDAKAIKNDLEHSAFTISDIEEKQKDKKPFPPFITATLTAQAAGKLKFPSVKTMKLAQSLYEAGLITYHRTDSTRISDDAVIDCRDWLKENNYVIPTKANIYANKDAAQDAHEAIRPTDISKLTKNLFCSDDEKQLYDLIWKRFVACQMKPVLYDTVVITIETSTNHILKASGRILKFKGWLEIMPDEDDNENDVRLPILSKKDDLSLVPPNVVIEQKFTKPPTRYTEKTLVEELKRRNIGRPSTYAAITSKIRDRNYVEEKKNIFYPTDLGKKVIDDLASYFDFMKYDYTAEMEIKLDLIAENKLSYVAMMKEFYPLLVEQLKHATSIKKIDYGFNCVKCKSMMDLKNGKFGYFLSCIEYPKCDFKMSVDLVDGKPVPKTGSLLVKDVKCARCGSGMVKKDGKFGPFYGCSTWPKCTAIQNISVGKQCSKCGNEMCAKILNGEMKLACMNYPNCSNIQDVPKDLKIDWTDPTKIHKGNISKKVSKTLSRNPVW